MAVFYMLLMLMIFFNVGEVFSHLSIINPRVGKNRKLQRGMYLSCRDYYCYILSCDSITKNIIILFFYNLVEEVMSISIRNQISLGQILCCCVSNAQGEIESFLLFFFFFLPEVSNRSN